MYPYPDGLNANICEANGEKFRNVIEFVQQIFTDVERRSNHLGCDSDTHPILDVVRLLGRQVQARYMTNVIISKQESPNADVENLLFNEITPVSSCGKSFESIKREVEWEGRLALNRDLILPWPWERNRLSTCITSIGLGRPWGEWTQDYDNHYIELWLPLGIGWVHGGNHSITSGIIQGVGEVKPEYVYDISGIYDYVYTDGENYLRIEDNSVISAVKTLEFASIFEIGRMMTDRSISF